MRTDGHSEANSRFSPLYHDRALSYSYTVVYTTRNLNTARNNDTCKHAVTVVCE